MNMNPQQTAPAAGDAGSTAPRLTRHTAILLSALAAILCCPPISPAQQPAHRLHPVLNDTQIVRAIDAAVRAREDAIAGYSVEDHYSIYLGQNTNPQAQKNVRVVFNPDSGKTITPIGQAGSPLLLAAIIDKVLESEIELSTTEARESVLINSTNYEMTPESTRVMMHGHQCIVVDLQARRSSPSLFNGKAWVDSDNFSFVHLEGVPSQAPNVLVGDVSFTRDYDTVDGLNMAVHAVSRAQSPLLGPTILVIDSVGYEIQHSSGASR